MVKNLLAKSIVAGIAGYTDFYFGEGDYVCENNYLPSMNYNYYLNGVAIW